ncbi:MAG: DUF1611 domain-containing protein [Gammaproteobacteria bacterium]|nr:MAG: DUF1611 domain-containing protein [Gammaproteobacteria bacterium]
MNIPTLPTSKVVSKNTIRLTGKRVAGAKRSFVTRNLSVEHFHYLATDDIRPSAGDVILARVDRLGQHQRLELPCGRRAHLFLGDEIIVSYGNRYAPDQFLAHIPDTLEPCSLVAAGGIASKVEAKHAGVKNATRITPLGFLANHEKQILNLKDSQLPNTSSGSTRPTVLAVVGSSMNGGKTTTMAYLARGLIKAGLSVGAAKVTGTGAGPDYWKMRDAGAYPVVDFTDMGYASTYRLEAARVESIMQRQIDYLGHHGVDIILLEIADGLLQSETAALLQSKLFHSSVDGVFFASAEALSVKSAVEWIQSHELPLLGVGGALTASPLVLEETKQLTSVPVFSKEELGSAEFYDQLLKLMPEQGISISNLR